MKTAVLATLLASAAAFAPSQTGKVASSTALSAFDNKIGVQAPLGLFDPLDLLTEDNFEMWRERELKHGRVAMLAFTGYVTTLAGVRLPGMESMKAGFGAFDCADCPPEVRGTLPLTLFTMILLEFYVMQDLTGEAEFPGDFRNGFDFGWDKQTDEWKAKKRAIELNNGRAAQMGILGIMTHELMGNLADVMPMAASKM